MFMNVLRRHDRLDAEVANRDDDDDDECAEDTDFDFDNDDDDEDCCENID